MNVLRRLGAAAAAALCALAVAAAAAAATSAPPDPAQVLGPVAIPHGAAREDVSVVAPDPAIVSGKRWTAEVHRIGQSTAAPAGGVDGGSFDWQDAGAGAALGLVALLAVGAYGLRSRAGGRPASDPAS